MLSVSAPPIHAKNSLPLTTHEAIIIGGSYAVLSAALTLGRSLRKTLVLDAGRPCNRHTPHSLPLILGHFRIAPSQ